MTIEAGAAMIEAETRCPAIVGSSRLRKKTYTARTVEAIVAMPAVMIVASSDRVISERWGLTTSDDSTPTKMLLETLRDSAPLMPMVLVKTREKRRMKKGMTPAWYRAPIRAAKKMIVAKPWNSEEVAEGRLPGFVRRAGGQGQPAENETGPGLGAVQDLDHGVVDEEKNLGPGGDDEEKEGEEELEADAPGDHSPVDRLPVARKQPGDKGQDEDAGEADQVVNRHGSSSPSGAGAFRNPT